MTKLLSLIRNKNFFLFFLVIFYLLAFIGITLPGTRVHFISLIPLYLSTSLAILLFFHSGFAKNFWIFFALVIILGILLEITGVKTSAVFGKFYYGKSLGIKIFDVPLLIGLNWLILVYCSISIVNRFDLPGQFQLLLSALIIVAFDVAMESVAPILDMWYWPLGHPQFQNYFAWFIAALLFITLSKSLRINFQNKIAPGILIIQFLFFVSLNISLRIF